jgi:hypothetical protein
MTWGTTFQAIGGRAGVVLAGAIVVWGCTTRPGGGEQACVTFCAENLSRWRFARTARLRLPLSVRS